MIGREGHGRSGRVYDAPLTFTSTHCASIGRESERESWRSSSCTFSVLMCRDKLSEFHVVSTWHQIVNSNITGSVQASFLSHLPQPLSTLHPGSKTIGCWRPMCPFLRICWRLLACQTQQSRRSQMFCHMLPHCPLEITWITSIIPPTQPKLHPPLAVNPDPQVVPPTHHLCSGMLDDQQNVETPCTNLYKIFTTSETLEHFASEPWNLHNKWNFGSRPCGQASGAGLVDITIAFLFSCPAYCPN